MDLTLYLRGVGLAVAGSALWLLYFDVKDRLQPEPRFRLVAAAFIGALAAVLAIGAFALVDRLDVPGIDRQDWVSTWTYCLLFIGPIEEGCKYLLFARIVARWSSCDEPIDGVIYACALAIGFAGLETVLSVPHVPLSEQLARAATAPLTHAVFAAIWGAGWARARFGGGSRLRRRAWVVLPFCLAAGAHGLYDFVLFAWDATLLASGIALVLWVALLVSLRVLSTGGAPARRSLDPMKTGGLMETSRELAMQATPCTTAPARPKRRHPPPSPV